MPISPADVERLAQLSRIEITSTEADAVRASLDAIFEMIGALHAADTADVMPMAHAQDMTLPLRDDRVTEADHHALFQRDAPAIERGLYIVPKVIE